MDDLQFEDFHHNIRRKIQGQNYDLTTKHRFTLKTELRAAKFEKLKKDLKQRTGRDGNQAVIEYAIELAWEKYQEEHQRPQERLNDLSETRN